ncbi:hypothetical protein AC578_4215 [Pseudocercospora eumusae]|uniref:Uncharacterized protein n=1 Tax=Pseudocercospora eumusae TaxID=321146 RepID=A0A139H3E0_9PEZI|nr:hypothetical protein AC578_4215 [Pseudocercospora eumusae]
MRKGTHSACSRILHTVVLFAPCLASFCSLDAIMSGVRMWHWLLPLIAWAVFCIWASEKAPRGQGCTRTLTDANIKHSILFSAPNPLPPPALSTYFERLALLAVSDVDYQALGERALEASGQDGLRVFDAHADEWLVVAHVMRETDWMQVIARNKSHQRDIDVEERAYVQGDGDLQLDAAKHWACHRPPYRSAWPFVALSLCWEYRSEWRTALPSRELRKMRYDVDELTKATETLLEELHDHLEHMQQYREDLLKHIRDMVRRYDQNHASYQPGLVQALRTRFLVSAMASAQSAALLDFAYIAAQLLHTTSEDLEILREDIQRLRKRASIPPAEAVLATRQRVSFLRTNGSYANTIRRLVDIFEHGTAILVSPPNEEQAHPIWYEMRQFWKQFYDEEDARRASHCLLRVAKGEKSRLEPDCLAIAECPVWKEWHVSKYPADRFWGDSLERLQIGTRLRR